MTNNGAPLTGMDAERFNSPSITRVAQVLLVLLFAVTLIRTAWVNDDAYITLRTVDNFVHGYGLTWNPGERVQAYTHPLWMFLLSGLYALTGEAYFTTLALSFTLSLSAVVLVSSSFTRNRFSRAAGLLILCLSPAFVEYSTSGLENPLTYLLVTLFLLQAFRLGDQPTKLQVFMLGLLASLAALNRLDSALLFLPALLWGFSRRRSWATFGLLALSALLVLLWEAFSLLYYGFPLPNTAYAKLNTGVAQADLLAQGWRYFTNALVWDPLTFLAVLAGTTLAFWKGESQEKALGAGVVLYLLYILSIGGDFMSGRFFAAPLLVCVILLMRIATRVHLPWKQAVLAAVLGLGLLAHSPTLLNTPKSPENAISPSGIADERAFYFNDSGLVNIDLHAYPVPNHPWARDGLRLKEQGGVSVQFSIGYLGYFAGPGVHIVDQYALAEPLLARLPIPDPKDWRIGHFIRPVPQGYVEKLETGANRLADPGLAQYVDKLMLITRGEIFDPLRLKTILEMNLGKYDNLLEEYIESQHK